MAGIDPNDFQRIAGGLARLFMPQDHTKQMQYQVAGSQIAENRANAGKLTQEQTNLAQLHDARAGAGSHAPGAMGIDPNSDMGQLVSNIMMTVANAEDGAKGFNGLYGGQMVRSGDPNLVRPGAVSMGMTPAATDALTAGEFQTHRDDAAAKVAADNAQKDREAQLHYGVGGATDRAARQATPKLYRAAPGDTLFDINGNVVGQGGPKITPTSPGDAKIFADQIAAGLPNGADFDNGELATAAMFAAQEASRTHDAAAAIQHALGLFTTEDHWNWRHPTMHLNHDAMKLALGDGGAPAAPAPSQGGLDSAFAPSGGFEVAPGLPVDVEQALRQYVGRGGNPDDFSYTPPGQQRAPAQQAAPANAAPRAGTVMDGYRFKGGNPADKSNWEKV